MTQAAKLPEARPDSRQDIKDPITQWLAEIQTLRQQQAKLKQERETAYASATRWRSLYETEAKQRRTEAALARQTIASLQDEIQSLQQQFTLAALPEVIQDQIQQQIAQITDPVVLQSQLTAAVLECDRLAQVLEIEQLSHSDTRKQLTTALGDAIDQLSRSRSRDS